MIVSAVVLRSGIETRMVEELKNSGTANKQYTHDKVVNKQWMTFSGWVYMLNILRGHFVTHKDSIFHSLIFIVPHADEIDSIVKFPDLWYFPVH